MFAVVIFVSCFYLNVVFGLKGKYNYLDAMGWNTKFTKAAGTGFCDGRKQSPIDVKSASIGSCNSPINITIAPYDIWHVGNNGVVLEGYPLGIADGEESVMRLQNNWSPNPSLNQEYCYDQFHFHWGLTDNFPGSEHSIDGQFSQLEVHFVHHSCSYKSLKDALTQAEKNPNIPDRYVLAVIGVMFEVSLTAPENPAINQLFKNGDPALLEQIKFPKGVNRASSGTATITQFNISQLLPDNLDYYYYEGGLTTPDCGEFVRWHLMKNKLTVSPRQMGWFRSLYANKITTLSNNVRPPQLNSFNPKLCTNIANAKVQAITWSRNTITKSTTNTTNYENIDVDGVLDDLYGNVTYPGDKTSQSKSSSPPNLIPFVIVIVILVLIIICVILWNLKMRFFGSKKGQRSTDHKGSSHRSSAKSHHSGRSTHVSSNQSSRRSTRKKNKYDAVSADDQQHPDAI